MQKHASVARGVRPLRSRERPLALPLDRGRGVAFFACAAVHRRAPWTGGGGRNLVYPQTRRPNAPAHALTRRRRVSVISSRVGPLAVGAVASRARTAGPSKRGSERKTAQPRLAELALADVGVAVAVGAQRRLGVVEVQRADAPGADDAASHSSSTAASPSRGADVVARGEQVAGVQAERRGARRRRRPRSARASSSNERPSVPPAPAVFSRCSGQCSLSASASRDDLAGALDRRRRPRRSCAEPGCRTTAWAPSASPARSEAISEASVLARISRSLGGRVEQVDGVDEQRVDAAARPSPRGRRRPARRCRPSASTRAGSG